MAYKKNDKKQTELLEKLLSETNSDKFKDTIGKKLKLYSNKKPTNFISYMKTDDKWVQLK